MTENEHSEYTLTNTLSAVLEMAHVQLTDRVRRYRAYTALGALHLLYTQHARVKFMH